ncbi:MAG: hypothetical protein WAZ77_05855 [Candidatus Nitrosopolaris sp.]
MASRSRWVTSEFRSGDDGKYNSMKYDVSLQPRIDAVLNHITELERIMCQSISKDGDISRHQVKNHTIHYSDMSKSEYLSTRKLNQVIHVSKILLERLAYQLRNVSNLSDIVIILSPAVGILKNIRSSLIPCIPDARQELCYICELLEVVLVDAAQLGGYTINFQTANESALHLISEASLNKGEELTKELSELRGALGND